MRRDEKNLDDRHERKQSEGGRERSGPVKQKGVKVKS